MTGPRGARLPRNAKRRRARAGALAAAGADAEGVADAFAGGVRGAADRSSGDGGGAGEGGGDAFGEWVRRTVEAMCREAELAVDGFAASFADCVAGPRPRLSTLDSCGAQLSAFIAILDGLPRERYFVSSLALKIERVRTALQRVS